MSNYIKAKVETLKDLDSKYFTRAMDAMGYKADFNKKEIETYWRKEKCDCVLTRNGFSTNIGLSFSKNPDNTIQMTVQADWDTVSKKYNADSFMKRFTVEYHTAKYTSVCESLGYVTESVEDMENGKRRMVLRRAA